MVFGYIARYVIIHATCVAHEEVDETIRNQDQWAWPKYDDIVQYKVGAKQVPCTDDGLFVRGKRCCYFRENPMYYYTTKIDADRFLYMKGFVRSN